MRYRRTDIVERAVGILDTYGLPDLSMRRIAAELGLQPSALYHHFASKQELLAAVADELLERGSRQVASGDPWDASIVAQCRELRDTMLAYRDGAELLATMHAFGLAVRSPRVRLAETLVAAGFDDTFAGDAAMTVLHFVFGHVSDEQTHLQAGSAGAIADHAEREGSVSFELGIGLILDGIRLRSGSVEVAGRAGAH